MSLYLCAAVYQISTDGWKATTYRVIETKKGKDGKPSKTVDKGWACDLVPKALLVARYYAKEQAEIDQLSADVESLSAKITELEEENGGEDGAFSTLEKVNKANVAAQLDAIEDDEESKEEAAVLKKWLALAEDQAGLKKRLKQADAALDKKAHDQYPKLTEAEVKTLVVDDKWLSTLDAIMHGEMDRISHALTQRIKDLAERYERPMPRLTKDVAEIEQDVNKHLHKMGFTWT
jgi:type I restriction enzyme M protein